MESDLQSNHHFVHDHHQQLQHHQKQINTSLTRYQSAPSSYFSSLLDRDTIEDFLNRPPSPETERIFSKFLSNAGVNPDNNNNNNNDDNNNDNNVLKQNITASGQQSHLMLSQQQQQIYYQTPPQPQPQPLPQLFSERKKMSGGGGGNGGGNNSNLTRHSSSPAGLFNSITIENGYVLMKGTGSDTIKREASSSYASSGKPPIASKPMSPIIEIDNNKPSNSGFPMDSWDDSSIISENINSLGEDDMTLSGLSGAETQIIDPGTRPPPLLAHHLSLPNDISKIKKLLQYQDTVPCKIRAKRGCATHPRSIAERVRRTKISERMRKLQELVPNMDKQTNTADMLDLAVDYVKELQKQVKTLSENRAKCTCESGNAKQDQP